MKSKTAEILSTHLANKCTLGTFACPRAAENKDDIGLRQILPGIHLANGGLLIPFLLQVLVMSSCAVTKVLYWSLTRAW